MTFRQAIIESMRRLGAQDDVLEKNMSCKPLDPPLLDKEMKFKPGMSAEGLISEMTAILSDERKRESFVTWLEKQWDDINRMN